MRTFIVSFLFCFLINACGIINTSYEVKKQFTYCYDGKYTGLDTLINTDGYYAIGQERDRYGLNAIFIHKIDTLYINFMFWPDGTFLYNFFDYNNNIPQYFRKIVENTKMGKKDKFYKHYSWGRYIITGDTIKAQYIHVPSSLNDYWYGHETAFKIINKSTLKYLSSESKILNYYATDIERREMKKSEMGNKYLPAVFMHVDVIPNSNCWLKGKNWFWCKNMK